MIPNSLSCWTVDVVLRLSSQGVFENDRFDFKEKLPHGSDESGKRRLRRTISAFANTRVGYLVFGVSDDRALSPDQRLVGVDPTIELPEHFGAHASMIQPSVDWTPRIPALTLSSGRLIHVIEIPQSRRRPHLIIEDERFCCMRRTNRGNEPMSLEEVRAAFVDDDRRRTDIEWLGSEVRRVRDTAERLNVIANNGGDRMQLAFARYRVDALRDALPRLFREISHAPVLVTYLQSLVDRCCIADEALAPLAAFESLPRARSYSGSAGTLRVLDVVRDTAPQIVINAGTVLDQLDRLTC